MTCPPCTLDCNQGRTCPAKKKEMTQDEVELQIKEAIQSQQPVWLGVWLDIEEGDVDVWLTVKNKPEQKENNT